MRGVNLRNPNSTRSCLNVFKQVCWLAIYCFELFHVILLSFRNIKKREKTIKFNFQRLLTQQRLTGWQFNVWRDLSQEKKTFFYKLFYKNFDCLIFLDMLIVFNCITAFYQPENEEKIYNYKFCIMSAVEVFWLMSPFDQIDWLFEFINDNFWCLQKSSDL